MSALTVPLSRFTSRVGVGSISLGVIVPIMADARKINRLCSRVLQIAFIGALCLIAAYIGLFLLICGPYGWAVDLLWLPGTFYGVTWIIVRIKQRNMYHDHDPDQVAGAPRHRRTTASKVQFEPKWKEELVCTMDERRFVIELTMGALTVYFPTPSKWDASAPEWAKGQWERVRSDLAGWCEQRKMPLVIEDQAWVHFD